MNYVFLYNGKAWFLEIDSLDILNEYIRMIWNIRHEDLLYDIKRIKEKQHPTSDIISMCEVLAQAKGTNIWKEFITVWEKQHKDMTEMILSDKVLYVNPVGGYCTALENIINRYESNKLKWPVLKETDIRIKKWPNGMHFYAYIGPVQVKDGIITKWDSESDARNAAMNYVNNKIKLK